MRILFIIFILGLASCGPKQGCTDDAAMNYDVRAQMNDGSCIYPKPEYVTFLVDSPKRNASLKTGDPLQIEAELSSRFTIHGYTLSVRDLTSDSLVWSNKKHVHVNPVSIDTVWYPENIHLDSAAIVIKVFIGQNSSGVSDTIAFQYE